MAQTMTRPRSRAVRAATLLPADPTRIGVHRVLGRLSPDDPVFLGVDPTGLLTVVEIVQLPMDRRARGVVQRRLDSLKEVRSPGLAPVLEIDIEGNNARVVTRYLDAPRLSHRLAPERLRQVSVTQLGGGVAHALAALHREGVPHGALRRDNILLTRNGPVVTHLTSAMRGGKSDWPDPRADESKTMGLEGDVWAWGHLVAEAAARRHGQYRPGPPATHLLPRHLRGLVQAALSRDPGARPKASELASSLLPMRADPRPVRVHPRPAVAATAQRGRKVPLKLTAVMALGGFGLAFSPYGPQLRDLAWDLVPGLGSNATVATADTFCDAVAEFFEGDGLPDSAMGQDPWRQYVARPEKLAALEALAANAPGGIRAQVDLLTQASRAFAETGSTGIPSRDIANAQVAIADYVGGACQTPIQHGFNFG